MAIHAEFESNVNRRHPVTVGVLQQRYGVWHIRHCDIREVAIDTGDDIIGRVNTQAVFAGDTCLINAAAFCDFTCEPCQLLVCDQCGQRGCASGGYVSFRRLGDAVVWLPAFLALMSDDEFERTQFTPPDYLTCADHVGAVIAPSVYAQLTSEIDKLPARNNLPPLTAKDVITSIQMVAPLQVLGSFPHPAKLNHEIILAVSDGDTDSEIQAVNSFIQSVTNRATPLAVMPAQPVSPVEFHLDGPGLPAWRDFVRFGNQFGISIQPFGVLVPEQAV